MSAVCVGSYTQPAWERMREVAVDRDQIGETFEDFERAVTDQVSVWTAAGYEVRVLFIDLRLVESQISWCAERDLAVKAQLIWPTRRRQQQASVSA